jgi:multiple sugar transport system substrate-binding protein
LKVIKKNKSALLLMIVISLMVFVTACGSSKTPTESAAATDAPKASDTASAAPTDPPKPTEKVKLKVTTWAGAGELREFEDVIKKVNDKSTAYEIEIQSIPADYYTKLQAMIAGKQAPDFMWLSQEYIPQYASLGVLAPLNDPLSKVKEFNKDDYFDGAYNVGVFKGETYSLPWISQPYMLYYNQDMFEKANVALPTNDWTWDDFMTAGKALTKDGKWGALLNNLPLPMMLWSYGGDVFDKDGNITLNSPESMMGLEMYQKIAKSGVTPERAQADSMGGTDMFKTGKVAMFIGGAGDDLEKSTAGKIKMGMVVPPKGTKQATFSWIGVTAMSKTTKNPEIAAQALVDMSKAVQDWKIPNPTKAGFDMISTARPDKAYAADTIKKAAEVARGFNNQPQQGEIDGAIWEKLVQPIEKGSDIKKAVDDTIAKFNSVIKK